MIIGEKEFDTEKNGYIMGILNVTPDSFSDGGKFYRLEDALKQTEKMIQDGATIIDVGGESTRPGYTHISNEEEISRVVPAIEAIKKRFDVAVALDTYHSKVAQAGILAGADMINDIWGLQYDQGEMAEVIAKYDVACCLMHNRNISTVGADKQESFYEDVTAEVQKDLQKTLEIAKRAGISENKICLDPGIGFGKTYRDNLVMMKHLDVLQTLGYPVLLGTSRKSMIGYALDLKADQRMEGTVATTVFGYMKGCRIFRVHDVLENARALKMTEAMANVEE